MNRYDGLPGRPKPLGRRALSTGLCIFLLAAGAFFWFALPAGSHLGINLHVVGIILVFAGLLGLVLPRLSGLPVRTDRLRHWVIPSGAAGHVEDAAAEDQDGEGGERPVFDDERPMVGDLSAEPGRSTLADDLLNAEKDPPL